MYKHICMHIHKIHIDKSYLCIYINAHVQHLIYLARPTCLRGPCFKTLLRIWPLHSTYGPCEGSLNSQKDLKADPCPICRGPASLSFSVFFAPSPAWIFSLYLPKSGRPSTACQLGIPDFRKVQFWFFFF
jgi:hypothetical protein